MQRLNHILILFICFLGIVDAQSQMLQRTGYLYSELSLKLSSMPGNSGNHYVQPDTLQLNTWKNTLNQLFLGNYTAASDSANTIGYNLVNFTDTFSTPHSTYLLLETAGSNFWGTYVYYPNYCRPVIIQAPHAIKDANTGLQGIHVFRRTKALFYQVNGTHRCNSSVQSTCTGTTAGCSKNSQPYPVSDLAHVSASIFQKTTEVVMTAFPNSYFFQLHGFTKRSSDPYVILSNGTTVTPSPDYISSFSANLRRQDTVLTFKIAHLDTNWTRLRGFWNTQSRLLNASPNPCITSATNTTGRFIHMEQERVRLRSNVAAWNKTANALNSTFPCIQVKVERNLIRPRLLRVYPNPTMDKVTLEWDFSISKNNKIQLFNTLGQMLTDKISSKQLSQNKTELDLSALPLGVYFIRCGNLTSQLIKQ